MEPHEVVKWVDVERRSDTEIIRELKERRYIKDGWPLWWSTDYAPDPREFLAFEEFKRRLVHLGRCNTRHDWRGNEIIKDVYLYPEPQVPITVLNLPIEGMDLPFLVTARPYHKKELDCQPFPVFLYEGHPLETLSEYTRSGGVIELPDHFYPHIRGLFAGKRGNHFFWYPLEVHPLVSDFGRKVDESLKTSGLSFVDVYNGRPSMSPTEQRTYPEVWRELSEKTGLVDLMAPDWIDFEATKVSAEEFLEDHQKPEDLLVFYPLRLPGIESTLPLVIATRTHNKSRVKKPVILGVYAENGRTDRNRRGGILRIKDYELSLAVSKAISEDFGIPVDAVLFTPQKGRPRYERVSGFSFRQPPIQETNRDR